MQPMAPEPIPPAASGKLARNVMHFARALRAAGLPVGPGQVLRALEAIEAVGLERRADLYWTLHAVFVNRRDQREIFDQCFHIFWRDPTILERVGVVAQNAESSSLQASPAGLPPRR